MKRKREREWVRGVVEGLWAGNQGGGDTKMRSVGQNRSGRAGRGGEGRGGGARPGSNEGEELKRMNKGGGKFFFHTMQRLK